MRYFAIVCFAAVLAAAAVSVGDVYDGRLELRTQVDTFRHIDRLFPSRTVPHGSPYPLHRHARQLVPFSFVSGGRSVTLDKYMRRNRIGGLLVLKHGRIALEAYGFGNTQATRWGSWSVAKSIASTLLGAAIRDGHVASIDDPVTKYLPELRGSAWEGVSARNVVQMASGIRWNEAYTDPRSDRRRMLEVQLQQRPGGVVRFLATLPRAAAPGTRWNYSTGETTLLGAPVRAAVKRPLSTYLSETIWSRFGMEADATWWLDSPDGVEIGGSGFSATLRDYGRFGLFVLGGGKAAGRQVVPPGWFPDAGRPKPVGGRLVPYGYMWWSLAGGPGSVHDGAFEAIGIFGQFLYINPRHEVAIVVWSARQTPTGSTQVDDHDFFAAAVRALAR